MSYFYEIHIFFKHWKIKAADIYNLPHPHKIINTQFVPSINKNIKKGFYTKMSNSVPGLNTLSLFIVN